VHPPSILLTTATILPSAIPLGLVFSLTSTNLLLVNFEGVTVSHFELEYVLLAICKEDGKVVHSRTGVCCEAMLDSHRLQRLTVSGLSSGRTLCPSNKKRTVDSCFPCRSQKAFINFSSFVDLLILKKTSLLLSVTLMFKCSVGGGGASWPPLGECSFSDMVCLSRGIEDLVGCRSLK